MDDLQPVLDLRRPAPGDCSRTDHGRTVRRWSTGGLIASLIVVAGLTLTPEGRGWAWGSPFTELTWYLTGLDSTATMLQLVGNLALLAVPAGLAALRWPVLARLGHLTGVALATGSGIEVLQWALPLGRVVSPLDAVLNATGAVAVGTAVAHLRRTNAAGWLLG
jgi:hypothetical protein